MGISIQDPRDAMGTASSTKNNQSMMKQSRRGLPPTPGKNQKRMAFGQH